MRRKVAIITIIILVILVNIVVFITLKSESFKENNIPENYVAVFHGGSGEQTYETYIYKIENGKNNYGFEYINTTTTTIRYGSTISESKITKKGSFDWTDEAFKIAEDNFAYSHVSVPGDDNIYTIEEFKKIFIKN